LVVVRELDDRGRGGEQGVAGQRLGSQLEKTRAAAEIGRGEIQERPAGAGGGVSIEDRVQRWEFRLQSSDFRLQR
jgi:hypothetical protein